MLRGLAKLSNVLALTALTGITSLLPLAPLGCGGGGGGAGAKEASIPGPLDIPVPPAPRDAAASPAMAAPTPPPAASSAIAEPPLVELTHESLTITPAIQAIVDAKDRTDADRKVDAGRHPAELLAFVGAPAGGKVAELGAGGGYTSELFAREVGSRGKVYGQNSKFLLERYAEKPWSERLKKPVMKNVVRLDRDFDDPFPGDVKNLDAVVINLFYHDTFWMNVDRAKMNAAIFAALKKGGVYVVIDHSGRPGTGATEAQSLHRIDERVVRSEVEKAGFKLVSDATFLRNPSDSRDWNASPMAAGEKRGTSDRFALKFVKP